MEFVRVIEEYDHLWAVKEPDKELDELTSLFEHLEYMPLGLNLMYMSLQVEL